MKYANFFVAFDIPRRFSTSKTTKRFRILTRSVERRVQAAILLCLGFRCTTITVVSYFVPSRNCLVVLDSIGLPGLLLRAAANFSYFL